MERINKRKKGRVRVARASEVWRPFHIRRPTGITGVDAGIGGGFPAGTINQICGLESAGKSYICDLVMANVQRTYGDDARICFATFGYGYDKWFGRRNGVVVGFTEEEIATYIEEQGLLGDEVTDEEIELLREEIGEFTEILLDSSGMEAPGENTLEAVLDIISSGIFQVVVVDEFNISETQYDADADLEDEAKRASRAKMNTDFVSKFYNKIKFSDDGGANETTILYVLESRVKMGATATRGKTPSNNRTGGYALHYAKATDLQVTSGSVITDSGKYTGKQIAKEIHWKINKGKLGVSDGAKGTYIYNMEEGADLAMDLYASSIEHGAIRRGGANYYDGDKLLCKGKDDFIQMLRDDYGLFKRIRRATLGAAGASLSVRRGKLEK